jgi:hypothetical protein
MINIEIPEGLDLNLLHGQLSDLPPAAGTFPLYVLPNALQTIINEAHTSLGMPADFLAGSMLFAASLGIGKTHRIVVKEGWTENAVLYLALVGRPGTNKSHPMSLAINPFIEHDYKSYKVYSELMEAYRAKSDSDEVQIPVFKKFLVSDFTPEALAEVHKHNQRGIGLYADELISWIKNFNRYTKGSEEQLWLSNWSGKAMVNDRRHSNLFIKSPFISVIGSLQPGVLQEISSQQRSDNGFLDRILFIAPDNLKKEYWNEKDLNKEVMQQYKQIISRLIDLEFTNDDCQDQSANLLYMSEDAKKLLFLWQRHNTDLINKMEKDPQSGAFSKLEIYVPRLALILQMLNWACGESGNSEIHVNAMEGAVHLAEYFRDNIQKIHHLLEHTDELSKLSNKHRHLYENLPQEFATQQGVEFAAQLGFSCSAFKRLLNKRNLFMRRRHGVYEKLF